MLLLTPKPEPVSSFRAKIVHWVSESLHSFKTVENQGFQSLMKTGRLEYYIPSPSTVSCDVWLVFARTHQRVAKMLQVSSNHALWNIHIKEPHQEYDGKISFTTDAWSSPNHWAFVAFLVHLEHKGVLLSLPLNIIEVAMVQNLPW